MWLNPTAGRGTAEDAGDRIVAEAERRGHSVDRVLAGSPLAAAALARAAIDDGADRLIVAGGDGSVHHAVQVVAETGVAFGVVPVGSGNDFAAAMGLPSTFPAAIACALGATHSVDLIRVGDRYGATVATLGLSVEVTIRAEHLRRPSGRSKYTVATLLELPRMRDYPLRLTIDGVGHAAAPNLVAIANTPTFGGGMRIAPGADARDGMLDVVLIGPTSRNVMLRLLPRAGSGGHIGHPAVSVLRGARIEIDADEPFRVDVDGEAAGVTPIAVEVRPGALALAVDR